jgi:hypothetical protein
MLCRRKLGSTPRLTDWLTVSCNVTLTLTLTRPPLWSSGQSSWLRNGDVLCFLLDTNWIYICYVEESRPPLWSSGQSSWLRNGDVLCFLRGTNWIYICYLEESRQPLWSSGQSSWLQIQRSGFDSQSYQIFWETVGLERGALSLVRTFDPSCWPRRPLYPQNLARASPTSCGCSVSIVRSRSQATELYT